MMAILSTIVISLALLGLGIVKNYYTSYKDDNVIEEFAEKVIKDQTGADIDLTPFSPENK